MTTADGGDDGQASDSAGLLEDASEIERHPEVSNQVLVAPSLPDDDTFNTIRQPVAPIACWRLVDHRFDFDSSFILPESRTDLQRLATMHDDYKDSPMSLFGHADPVGTDTYNKTLSGSRAKSTFALLTRNFDMWEALFHDHDWGLRSTQRILHFLEEEDLKKPDATDEQRAQAGAFAVDGKDSAAWKEAVKRFQAKPPAIAVDGDAGKNTRRKLYEVYMDTICCHLDGTPFKVEPTQFLGKGADSKGKAAYQGCSEFNPLLLLSEADEKKFKDSKDNDGRNAANSPNRRVVMYFFAPNLVIDPTQWPCPRADEGTAGCKKRFWSDHDTRIKPASDTRREYRETKDTFACRFYDRLAFRSPCEAGFKEWIVQLIRPGTGSPLTHEKVAGVRFQAVASGHITRGMTDINGTLRVRAQSRQEDILVTLKIPLPPPDGDKDQETKQQNDTGGSAPPQFSTLALTLFGGQLKELDGSDDQDKLDEPDETNDSTQPAATDGSDGPDKNKAIVQRLVNLGYGPSDPKRLTDPKVLSAALLAFQQDHKDSHGLGASGNGDDATVAALKDVYGS